MLLLVSALLAPAIPAQTDRRALTVDDFFAIQRVRDPRVSPEGVWVAYTVTGSDLEKDESETAVWMIPAAGGEAIRMTATGTSASRPRWSPDGKYLSFQAARGEGKTQVWLLDRRGGEAQQLTEVEQGIEGYEWSPDGKRLVLIVRDPEPKEAGEAPDDQKKDGEKKEKPKPWVIDRLQFKRDNVGYLDRRREHLYLFSLEDRSLRQITFGDHDDSQPAWSPDGERIAFVSNRTPEPDANDNADVWVVPAGGSEQQPALLQVTTNTGNDSQPAWSPDGSLIAYTTLVRPEIIWYATRHLAVVEASGGTPRLLTAELDRHVADPRFGPDGAIYFLLEDSGEQHLARVTPGGGQIERVVSGQQVVSDYHLGPDGEAAVLLSRPDLPGEVFLAGPGRLEKLTETNDALMARLDLGEVREIHFSSGDGTPVEGFLFTPPGYREGRSPTLLRIHGGPVAQYDFGFDFQARLFAAHGYVVVQVNPRGSSGYGEEFSLGIFQSWGEKDYEDVMAGVDYAIREGYADPQKLGVGGWSYGGILTNYVITRTDRFAAAVTGASEVLYVSNYGHDHYQYEWEMELGLPWENRELWERISPFNRVEKIVTPTLIVCGEKDWNVPVLNSEQLYQALRRLGRTTQLVVYPGEHHSIRRPSFQKDRLERYLEWYGRYVKGEAPAGPEAAPPSKP